MRRRFRGIENEQLEFNISKTARETNETIISTIKSIHRHAPGLISIAIQDLPTRNCKGKGKGRATRRTEGSSREQIPDGGVGGGSRNLNESQQPAQVQPEQEEDAEVDEVEAILTALRELFRNSATWKPTENELNLISMRKPSMYIENCYAYLNRANIEKRMCDNNRSIIGKMRIHTITRKQNRKTTINDWNWK